MSEAPTCRVCNAPTGDETWLCRADTEALETNLGELPALLAELEVNRSRQARGIDGGRTHRAKPGSKLPIDLGASDLQRDVEWTLTRWAWHLAETRGAEGRLPRLTYGPRCNAGPGCYHASCAMVRPLRAEPYMPSVISLISWLLRYMNSVRLDEACAELWHDVERLHHRLTRTIDRPAQRLYSGPCEAPVARGEGDTARTEKCPADLYALPGAPEIKCDGWTPSVKDAGQVRAPGCGATHTAQDRHGFQLDAIEDGRLAPLHLLRVVVPKLMGREKLDRRRPQQWLASGRLTDHGLDRNGDRLVSGAEFCGLVRDFQPRTRREVAVA